MFKLIFDLCSRLIIVLPALYLYSIPGRSQCPSDMLKGQPKGQAPGRHSDPHGKESLVQRKEALLRNRLHQTVDAALIQQAPATETTTSQSNAPKFTLKFTPLLSPSISIARLVHDPRLHHVRRRAHRSSHQTSTDRGNHMHQMTVGQIRFPQNPPLRRVVGGQVAQIHQRRSLHIRHAALPQRPEASTTHNLSKRVSCAVHTRLHSHQPPLALHLHLHLDQVGRRGQPLRQRAGRDTAEGGLEQGQGLAIALADKVIPHLVVRADPHSAVDDVSVQGWCDSLPQLHGALLADNAHRCCHHSAVRQMGDFGVTVELYRGRFALDLEAGLGEVQGVRG